jgi:MerR family transcriptional regulator, light-induced transcriptional regulator
MVTYSADHRLPTVESGEALDPKILQDPSREALLKRVISKTVIPIVLKNNTKIIPLDNQEPHPTDAHIEKLTTLLLGPDNADAVEFIYFLRNSGISLDNLHLELLEPTARHLGEMWDKDQLDFYSVAAAVNKLQRIVHHFADLDRIQPYDDKRRALITVTPGENHSFGNQIVQKFLRAAGWSVLSLPGQEIQKVVDTVSKDWFAVVGFSISGRSHINALTTMIRQIRSQSLNPFIGVMIGGPAVAQEPDLVEQVGADGTANNAAAAVILAKKILAEGLISASNAAAHTAK